MITIEVDEIIKKKKLSFETPYYYVHDISDDLYDCTIYGKITDTEVISINITNKGAEKVFEISKISMSNFDSYKCYLTKEFYKSNESEFKGAYKEALEFIKSIKDNS